MKSKLGNVLKVATVSLLVLGGWTQVYGLTIQNGGFEGISSFSGPVQPAYPDQAWWVKDGSGNLGTDYATWSIASGAGIGGSACAIATPGALAEGNSENYRVGLRQYYMDVAGDTTYTINFSYKAIGDSFDSALSAAARSEMGLVVLESQNIAGGSWQWENLPLNPQMKIGTAANDWTAASYTFTTLSTTKSIGIKFGILFGTEAHNSGDSFALDNVSVPDGGMTLGLLGLGMAGLGMLRRKLG
jgi:hypothetical protein